MKPTVKRNGVSLASDPDHRVASQLKTLIPVGIAMIIVADVKYARVSTSRPTVYL